MKWIPYGPHALLIEFATSIGDEAFDRCRAIVEELDLRPPRDLAEVVPSFTRVLVRFHPRGKVDSAARADALVSRLRDVSAKSVAPVEVKDIPAVYDGPDLGTLAEAHGLSTADVIELHSRPVYKVYLLGFAPGFPYLGELDPRLHTPRKPTPRTLVPAGSIAIGGEHTGIYPADGPGGWHLIARTTTRLFDDDAGRPFTDERERFYLRPGDRVRFVPVAD